MTSALAYKEFRETLPIAAVGLAALLLVALDPMGYSPVPNLLGYQQPGRIPFIGNYDTFTPQFAMAASGLAIALGFWQSLSDFWGDAHLFVLHRPASRRRIYGVKLLVGLAAYLLCALVPILLYAVWAATPGTHASPFEWSMTASVWFGWISLITIYLGAFLSGIRPAAWIGTRLAPLAAAAAILMLVTIIAVWFPVAGSVGGLLVLLITDAVLVFSILGVVEVRNFA